MPNQPETSQVPRPWLPRFGFGTMLLVMLVFSVMGAAGYYLYQGIGGSRRFQLAFILFTLSCPLLLAVALSLARLAYDWLNTPRRRRP